MLEYIKSILKTTIVNAIFYFVWTYNYYAVVVEDRLKSYGIESKMFLVTNRKTEPELDKWTCTVTLNNNLKMLECYVYDDDELNMIGDEVLYLKKIDDKTMLSRINVTLIPLSLTPNEVTRFINIMYFHPKMPDPIKLKLDDSYIQDGNEVFSKTFVSRMLSYQYDSSSYYFDDTYNLQLMDNKINQHTIRSTQYLLFEKDGYTIKELSKIN